jgi:hypothetical protein
VGRMKIENWSEMTVGRAAQKWLVEQAETHYLQRQRKRILFCIHEIFSDRWPINICFFIHIHTVTKIVVVILPFSNIISWYAQEQICLSFTFLKTVFLCLRHFHECAQLQLVQLQIFSSHLFSSSDKQVPIASYKTTN